MFFFRFALNKDDQTTFISAEGKLNLQAVQWSEPPQEIVHDPPFLIGMELSITAKFFFPISKGDAFSTTTGFALRDF